MATQVVPGFSHVRPAPVSNKNNREHYENTTAMHVNRCGRVKRVRL